MEMTLTDILNMVGKLDDAPGEDTPRERFRRHLGDKVTQVGQVKDYVEECLRESGPQYSRALQDLVNHVGTFLGFTVEYGRYQGVSGQVGHDGLWQSPTQFSIVLEVKTTDVYAIKTSTLLGYIGELVSGKKITSDKSALGLYVVGRQDRELRQLESCIVAESRTDRLRIIAVESLLSLAELLSQYDITHEDILAVLKPSGPTIDPVVGLMARLLAQQIAKEEAAEPPAAAAETPSSLPEAHYWITPVKSGEERTAEEEIRTLVGDHKVYAFGERTAGRRLLAPGDWICFYATQTGVVGYAQVASAPARQPHRAILHPEEYPWTFALTGPQLYVEEPVVIDAELRGRLNAFDKKNPEQGWAWFVQATHRVTKHDFDLLTRHTT